MPRASAPRLAPIAVAAALALGARARAADTAPSNEHYLLRAELGPELDTNAHRTEEVHASGVVNPPAVVSPLARAVVSASLQDLAAEGHQVACSATVAGKLFEKPEARSEDVGIIETSLAWRAALGETSASSLSAAYYEAFQRAALDTDYANERRDFRSITAAWRLSRLLGDHTEGGAGVGFRTFVFKPDRSYDFLAPSAALDLRWARETADGAADWEVAARATYEQRFFYGKALVGETCATTEMCPPTTGNAARVDHFATAALEATRTGRVLVGLGYAFHVNLSNSFGETVTRHFVTGRFAADLPLGLSLATRVELLVAHYSDPIYVAETDTAGRPFVSIEDENRSNLRVDLSHDLGDRLQLLARYTFYTNELATTNVTYRRQTALLFLAYTFEK
ncbi:MAG TPA: hypothetical protein VHJ20_19490 [Polyangia bacterium]|nr:hypothetical protein [Polyangia bacterium]